LENKDLKTNNMNLVADLEYNFSLSIHARVGLAFRYGIEVEEGSISAFYLGPGKKNAIRLSINGKTVNAITVIKQETRLIVTVLPKDVIFQHSDANRLFSGFDVLFAASPNLFSLAEVIQWRSEWVISQQEGNIKKKNVDALRDEARRRRKNLPETHEIQSDSPDDSTNNKNAAGDESVAEAWSVIQRLKEENNDLEEELLNQQSLLMELHLQANNSDPESSKSEPIKDMPTFDIDDIDEADIRLGAPDNGVYVSKNTKGKKILRHDDCVVCHVSSNEQDKNDFYEVVVKYQGFCYVLITKFKTTVSTYRVGDNSIYTVKYGRHNFLNPNVIG